MFPEYGEGWKNKIVISGGIDGQINHFQLVVQTPAGEIRQERLAIREYLQIVAATNYRQRICKTVEYFHGRSAAELAAALKISEQQASNVYRDIEAKRSATRYMRLKPVPVEAVTELAELTK